MRAPPRVLHLYANYKWTGPADPAIRCAVALRDIGMDVVFAQAGWTLPGAEHRMKKELARARLPVIGGLELRRHLQPFSVLRDRRALAGRLRRDRFDILHTHQKGDHLIAALARRSVRRRDGRQVVVVRSLYDPEPPKLGLRERLSFRETDGIVVPTARCRDLVIERYGFVRERVLHQEPPVDWRRFAELRGDRRAALGLAKDHFAVGITARIQPHRRFELLWATAARVVQECPNVRFILFGRGNEHDTETLVNAPVRRHGLEEHVLLPGYLYEPDYSLSLRSLQAFLFLVPGSDGTCRAVREAMAAGLPVVATPRGVLPDLVKEAGRIGDSAEALADHIVALVKNDAERARLAHAAATRARESMDAERAARDLQGFYARLLATQGADT